MLRINYNCLSVQFRNKLQSTELSIMEEINMIPLERKIIEEVVEAIVRAHNSKGVGVFGKFNNEIYKSMNGTRPERKEFDRILSLVEKYVGENFNRNSSTRCWPGDLDKKEMKGSIIEYVSRHLDGDYRAR